MEIEEMIELCNKRLAEEHPEDFKKQTAQLVNWLNELITFRKASKSLKLKPTERYLITDGKYKGQFLDYDDMPDSMKERLPRPVTNEEQMHVLRNIEMDVIKVVALLQHGRTDVVFDDRRDAAVAQLTQQVADAEKRVKEQAERADTAESVSDVLKEKVLFWQGLVKDITTVLGNNTDMFHECMDSWITRMVDDDDEARMRSLANSIAERLHSVKKIEWGHPLSCVDLKVCAVTQSHE